MKIFSWFSKRANKPNNMPHQDTSDIYDILNPRANENISCICNCINGATHNILHRLYEIQQNPKITEMIYKEVQVFFISIADFLLYENDELREIVLYKLTNNIADKELLTKRMQEYAKVLNNKDRPISFFTGTLFDNLVNRDNERHFDPYIMLCDCIYIIEKRGQHSDYILKEPIPIMGFTEAIPYYKNVSIRYEEILNIIIDNTMKMVEYFQKNRTIRS